MLLVRDRYAGEIIAEVGGMGRVLTVYPPLETEHAGQAAAETTTAMYGLFPYIYSVI